MRAAVIGLLACAACVNVSIDADGATRVRALGNVSVETHSCALADAHAPTSVPPCVSIKGSSVSEAAGGIVAAVFGFLLGR